ncbi:hypothetical protein [Aquimarina algiphila]|uniref:Uncharacterized protein n=1 Tax=Aquimarina algiphila TaxID=2047982 RepID=A0A554VPC0_9FLAO|nr:hypothetical protein [Aquimarina algiphila]TSE10328.1 hypothetical protein FOF46_04655 [Aquimarina algiphila]
MSQFEEAKYLEIYITIEDYIDKVHYQKIFCPECKIAPIHIVRKQKIPPYFASNRKEEHHQDCQHYEEFIPNKNLVRLINSNQIEDQKRLEFLIRSNLKASLRLLLGNEKGNNFNTNFLENNSSTNTEKKGNTDRYKKESIPRVHIKNLRKKEELLDNHIIIYGKAELEIKNHERTNKQTKEKFTVKQLIFRREGKFVFSISLSGYKANNLSQENGNISFAVFGELKKNSSFLNIKSHTLRICRFVSDFRS